MTIQELLAGLETESNEKLKVVVFNVEDGEIAVYTRSDIDLEEYRGWENLRVAFWGVNGDRVIIHTAVREQQPIQGEKRRMTCREWLEKNVPDAIDISFVGGCFDCPKDYRELKGAARFCEKYEYKSTDDHKRCKECWSQPVPEGVEE